MLRSIRIQHFRSHVDTFVDFEKVTTIVGENGSGKTSILEAINFAMSPSYLRSKIDEQDFNNLDQDAIEISLALDPFKVFLRDGFQTREVSCDGIEVKASRRQ